MRVTAVVAEVGKLGRGRRLSPQKKLSGRIFSIEVCLDLPGRGRRPKAEGRTFQTWHPRRMNAPCSLRRVTSASCQKFLKPYSCSRPMGWGWARPKIHWRQTTSTELKRERGRQRKLRIRYLSLPIIKWEKERPSSHPWIQQMLAVKCMKYEQFAGYYCSSSGNFRHNT